MKQMKAVMRNQFDISRIEKGMIIFSLIVIVVNGIMVPLLYKNPQTFIASIILFSVVYTKPMLAASFAMERMQKTLEPLLCTPIKLSFLFWGKTLFCFLSGTIYFTFFLVIAFLTANITHMSYNLTRIQMLFVILSALSTFFTISFIGVYVSAKSVDITTANRRLSKFCYTFFLLVIIYIGTLFVNDFTVTVTMSILFFSIHTFLFVIYIRKIRRITHSFLFENLFSKVSKLMVNDNAHILFCSPFAAIVRHEAKYFLTLKALLGNYLFMMLCPAIIFLLFGYYKNSFNLNYVILVIAFMMPRIPTNLISYSIGGEKAYKTGEALLSTPLKTLTILLAKSFVPVIVSATIIVVSSILALLAVPLYNALAHTNYPLISCAPAQMILLYPICFLSCIVMIFITGILSLILKTPRQGLIVTILIGYLSILPIVFILFIAKNTLLWTIVYLCILVIGIICFIIWLRNKISRPMIVCKL